MKKKKKSEFATLETMAAKMKLFWNMKLFWCYQFWREVYHCTTENNNANNLNFFEDEEGETNMYDSQGNML